MNDPKHVEEVRRKRQGWNRTLAITRTRYPHPRRGGTRGYDVNWRRAQIMCYDLGLNYTASKSSIFRWKNRIDPYLMNGNRESEAIIGIDQYNLCTFLLAWPEARIDEIIAFMANAGTGTVFTRSQVSKRMKDLGLTKKVSSTEAKQAFLPMNMLKRRLFWTQPVPFGVAGADRRRLIDIDECGIELQSTNRKYGHSAIGLRVVKPGHYSKDTKLTILLAVEAGDPQVQPGIRGSVTNPRRWLRILQKGGTSTIDFDDFVTHICNDLMQNPVPGQVGNNERIFLWDNLSSHCSPLIHQTVEGNFGHIIIRRPPYKPSDAPIEYIFCQLIVGLQFRTFQLSNIPDLMHAIQVVVTNLKGFDNLFQKLGY